MAENLQINLPYAALSPADRERALANLDRYFEIVLQIFVRTEGHAQDAHTSGN
jgi:hypothetical protein